MKEWKEKNKGEWKDMKKRRETKRDERNEVGNEKEQMKWGGKW